MEIQNRVNAISFNSSLLNELRAIDFVDRLIRQGKLSPDDYRLVRVHIVENHEELMPLGASSKMNVEWEFLIKLRDLGRAAMTRWLDENFEAVGKRNTVDVRAMFQGIGRSIRDSGRPASLPAGPDGVIDSHAHSILTSG
jgi:NTE family protein